uniref:Uncharacterized protein n=1 Tax=Anguilla anguilla TaxID=7936 RepID=A0A0E9SKT4_ANGAN
MDSQGSLGQSLVAPWSKRTHEFYCFVPHCSRSHPLVTDYPCRPTSCQARDWMLCCCL